MLIYAVALVLLTFVTSNYAEPVAYRFFPPSPTATLRPTITLTPSVTITPSITLTPTITETPSETNTPTITPTPMIPVAIEARFEGEVTSIPNAVFSPLEFSQGIDALYRPLNPGFEFANPVGHLYAVFSYDGMVNGVQWTALWYRNGELVHFETKPWDGSTGGFGYSDWEPDSIEWLPGLYQVQMFVGLEWKVVGDFSVAGEPPTQTASLSPTITETPAAHDHTYTNDRAAAVQHPDAHPNANPDADGHTDFPAYFHLNPGDPDFYPPAAGDSDYPLTYPDAPAHSDFAAALDLPR